MKESLQDIRSIAENLDIALEGSSYADDILNVIAEIAEREKIKL